MSVALIDHLTDDEARFRLMRLVEWAGFDLASFTHYRMDGFDESSITEMGSSLPSSTNVCLLMGASSTRLFGITQPLLSSRGYIYPGPYNWHLIPTVHPGFIQKGNAKWSAAFINDLQKAVRLDQEGLPPQILDYQLDPLPMAAYSWAQDYRAALLVDPSIKLAFDIETPGKGEDEDDIDTDSDAPDRTWNIERISFSFAPLCAISFPWSPEYFAAVALCLSSTGDKVVWNQGFDVPRLRRTGQVINGTIHDGMVAWHILHSDLPKRLGFVATFTCPWQSAWKHLSGAKPAFYSATDSDVELRCMASIELELRSTGLWDVYQRDVLDLEPILVHMNRKGMPVDPDIRLDRALRLQGELVKVKEEMSKCIPLEARKVSHVYKSTPKLREGLALRPGSRVVAFCSICGAERPRKDHFKRFSKKCNPCAEGGPVKREVKIDEYYRLAEFSPSRDQLVRYHAALRRPNPTVWDKKQGKRKVSFGERELKVLQGKFPQDKLYPLVLSYRELDKLASCYIGRPDET